MLLELNANGQMLGYPHPISLTSNHPCIHRIITILQKDFFSKTGCTKALRLDRLTNVLLQSHNLLGVDVLNHFMKLNKSNQNNRYVYFQRAPFFGHFPGGLRLGQAVRVRGMAKDNAER